MNAAQIHSTLSTRTRLFSKPQLFLCGLAVRPHANAEPGHWNLNVFENSCQGEDFQKHRMQCYRVDRKTRDFGLWRQSMHCYLRLLETFSGFWLANISLQLIISPPVGLACSWQCVIACVCIFMWTEIFFFKWKKEKLHLWKYPCTCGHGLRVCSWLTHKTYPASQCA